MVVLRDSGPVRSLLNGDVSVHILKTWSGLPRGARLLAAVPDLARYLRDRKPALLHSPGNHTHMAAALAVRLARYRSEEHTAELQSLMRISYAVFCLKKTKHTLT